MSGLSELFSRLEKFEASQKRLLDDQKKLESVIVGLRKELTEVRGIASQLKQYFNTLSDQNKRLMSPTTNQSEVS